MGVGADAGDLAGQDAKRLSAKEPPGQMLGGAQSAGGETPGPSLRQLRGESRVAAAQSTPPWFIWGFSFAA